MSSFNSRSGFIFLLAAVLFLNSGIIFFDSSRILLAEATPAQTHPAGLAEEAADPAQGIVWIGGRLPLSSRTEGQWYWDEKVSQDGVISHTGIENKARSSYSFKTEAAVELNRDSRIIQYVFLDPKLPPLGIMMKFFLKDQEAISIYWEGEEEAFADTENYITAWYGGPLPKIGRWQKLEIELKELDLTEAQLEGLAFITSNGRVWWGKTVIVK